MTSSTWIRLGPYYTGALLDADLVGPDDPVRVSWFTSIDTGQPDDVFDEVRFLHAPECGCRTTWPVPVEELTVPAAELASWTANTLWGSCAISLRKHTAQQAAQLRAAAAAGGPAPVLVTDAEQVALDWGVGAKSALTGTRFGDGSSGAEGLSDNTAAGIADAVAWFRHCSLAIPERPGDRLESYVRDLADRLEGHLADLVSRPGYATARDRATRQGTDAIVASAADPDRAARQGWTRTALDLVADPAQLPDTPVWALVDGGTEPGVSALRWSHVWSPTRATRGRRQAVALLSGAHLFDSAAGVHPTPLCVDAGYPLDLVLDAVDLTDDPARVADMIAALLAVDHT